MTTYKFADTKDRPLCPEHGPDVLMCWCGYVSRETVARLRRARGGRLIQMVEEPKPAPQEKRQTKKRQTAKRRKEVEGEEDGQQMLI